MKIDIQAISDKGRVRENNEDALSIGGVFLRDDAMNLTVDVQENAVFYLLVSDGMGGHEKGEAASEITLDEMNLMWIPVTRSWRLNERHYGALQGLDKAETAA